MAAIMFAMQRVRVRIRSWRDLVVLVAAAVIYYLADQFFELKLGWESKKSSTVAGIISVAIVVIGLIVVT